MPTALRTPLLVAIAATALVALSVGIRQTFGLYLRPMTEAYGWGREVFAIAIAVQNLMWGVMQPFTGMLADRYGSGRVLALGGAVYAVGLLFMAQAATPLALTLSAGVIIPMGLSATGFAVVFGAVSRSVPEHRRGLYSGLAASGGSIGQFVMLPVGQTFIANLGWVEALGSMVFFALAIPVLAVLLTGRAERGMLPTGVGNPVQALGYAGKQGRYWLLFWGFFVCGFHVAFISTHLPAFLTDNAIAPSVAALALSIIGLFNIGGSITLSWLGGRMSRRKLLCSIYLARAAIIGLFVTLPLSTGTVLAFGAGMGFLWLATVPLTSGLVGQMFGVRYLSTLFGIVFLGHQLGSFLGVWLGGRVYDTTGSYDLVWYIAVALGVFSALVHWPIDERSDEAYQAARQARAAPQGGG